MIVLIIFAVAWAVWDLFVFQLPKDNGYFSLKTVPGNLKFDFPHHVKWIAFFIVALMLIDNIYMLVLACILVFGAQAIFYTYFKTLIKEK